MTIAQRILSMENSEHWQTFSENDDSKYNQVICFSSSFVLIPFNIVKFICNHCFAYIVYISQICGLNVLSQLCQLFF
jgi:hypothetical protein